MVVKENDGVARLREILTEDDIERIEKRYEEGRKTTPCTEPNIIINIDNEFGNILIKVGDRLPKKSTEGEALVTVGVSENGELAYISIETEDEELAKFIRTIKKAF